MAFPSPDPLWVLEVFKVIVIVFSGLTLLIRWARASQRFYSDIPFIISWGFFAIAGGEIIDILFHSELLAPYDLFFYKLRAVFPAIATVCFLIATLLIWLPDRPRTRGIITSAYFITFLVCIVIAPSDTMLILLVLPLLIVIFILFGLSFLLAWIWKRLPEVHGLLVFIGALVYMVGQMGKPLSTILAFPELYLYSEMIDLLGLFIFWVALNIKPGYAK